MKITKKILSVFLAAVMVLSLLPAAAFATGTEENVVYLSISFDDQYISDKNGNPIVYMPVSLDVVSAIDLTEYGLDNMWFEGAMNEDGTYKPTALQLLIYAHEELYGGDWSDVNFDALPGSSYFAGGIFGFTENLVYFHNGDFPVDETQESSYMTVGATSDRIVLEAGDFLDVASFSCYSFLWDPLGGFHLFADQDGNYVHDYVVEMGETLPVKLMHSFCDLMFGEAWVQEAAEYEVYYGRNFGEAEGSVTTDDIGCAEILFEESGVYYVWCDGGNGSDDGTHGSCDYYGETELPCIVSAPAYAKVTVSAPEGEPEAEVNVSVGEQNFTSLNEAFAYQIESGEERVSLCENVTVEYLVMPVGAVLDLNGYTLTADTFDSFVAGAKIVDTTEGDGLLSVTNQCTFSPNNPQLPLEDKAADGFRFFTVNVESVAVTGKKSANPKCWFQVQFENFEKVYQLICAGAEFAIEMLVTVDGKTVEAVASRDFLLKWAESYKTNKKLYITYTFHGAEGNAFSAIPSIGASGVNFTGDTMQENP